MSSLMKGIANYFQKKPPAEECPEEAEELVMATVEDFDEFELASFLKKICYDDELEKEPEEDEERISENKCAVRHGIVTSLRSETGFIDINIVFDLQDAPCDIQEGDSVTYLGYKKRDDGPWLVRKVLPNLIEKKKIAMADLAVTVDSASDGEVVTVRGKVTKRQGRLVIVDHGRLQFHLDAVTAKFTPIKGDFLFLDVLVRQTDKKSRKLTIEVRAIHWVEYQLVASEVTEWKDEKGQIGPDIVFARESCKAGFVPEVGVEVNAEVILCKKGRCKWRALQVIRAQTIQRSVQNGFNAPDDVVTMLLRNKRGIIVLNKADLDFGQIREGEFGKTVDVVLANEGTEDQEITHGYFYQNKYDTCVWPQMRVHNVRLNRGHKVKFSFGCRGVHIGFSKECFVFAFRGFEVGAMFQMEVVVPELQKMVQDHSRSDRNCNFYQGLSMGHNDDTTLLINGERPIQPPKFIVERLPNYNIPARFWEAVLDQDRVLKHIPDVQKMIEKISPSLHADLNYRNYKDRFHSLLYLEEIDGNLKLGKYSLKGVILEPAGENAEFYSLRVPGLEEKRPSLLVGDKVVAVRAERDSAAKYEGFIHKTFLRTVWLKFSPLFHDQYQSQAIDVNFEFGRTALRRQHFGIDMSWQNLPEVILFPSRIQHAEPQVEVDVAQWNNNTLNEYQREVVRNILRGVARPLPYIIFGPPGTGKTVTLVELIYQIFTCLPRSKLLIATPSNSSANLLAERLIDTGKFGDRDLVRLVGFHVLQDKKLSDKLLPFCTTGNIQAGGYDFRNRKDRGRVVNHSADRSTLNHYRVIVGTCVALGQLVTMGFTQEFTHLIVDEAGQATEPEILVPLSLIHNCGQVVLAGDPLQLGPVVGSNLASQYGLGESFMDRLISRFPYQRDCTGFPSTAGYDPRLVSRLVDNYRSLPELLTLPNRLFYESHLVATVDAVTSPEARLLETLRPTLPRRDAAKFGPAPPAVVFYGIVGTNLQDVTSPSWFNPQEVYVVQRFVAALYRAGLAAEDVGVITPYRQQVERIKKLLERYGLELPKIGSVEEFQGQERKVVIMSAVRSNAKIVHTDVIHSLGFVASAKRLNVTLTRAQCLNIVVGDPYILMHDSHWCATIEYCVERGSYAGTSLPFVMQRSRSFAENYTRPVPQSGPVYRPSPSRPMAMHARPLAMQGPSPSRPMHARPMAMQGSPMTMPWPSPSRPMHARPLAMQGPSPSRPMHARPMAMQDSPMTMQGRLTQWRVLQPSARLQPNRPLPTLRSVEEAIKNDLAKLDNHSPDQAKPDLYSPDQAALRNQSQDGVNGDYRSPDQAKPDSPDEARPDHYSPDQAKPDHYSPDQAKPDHYSPDQAKPDSPDEAGPAYYSPDQAKPDYYSPDQAKPDSPDEAGPAYYSPDQAKQQQPSVSFYYRPPASAQEHDDEEEEVAWENNPLRDHDYCRYVTDDSGEASDYDSEVSLYTGSAERKVQAVNDSLNFSISFENKK